MRPFHALVGRFEANKISAHSRGQLTRGGSGEEDLDESTLKEKLPALVYDQLWKIDFNLFMLISQAIGRTFLPPYWSLGFQLSRWGYNKIETVKNLVENMTEHDLPQVTYSILWCNDNILHKNLFRFNIFLS